MADKRFRGRLCHRRPDRRHPRNLPRQRAVSRMWPTETSAGNTLSCGRTTTRRTRASRASRRAATDRCLNASFPISDAGFASLFPGRRVQCGEQRIPRHLGRRRRSRRGHLRPAGARVGWRAGSARIFPIGSLYGGIRSAVAWSPASSCYLVVFWGPGRPRRHRKFTASGVAASGALLGANFNISDDCCFFRLPGGFLGGVRQSVPGQWDNEDGNIHGRRVNAATGAIARRANHRHDRRRERPLVHRPRSGERALARPIQ